MAEMTREFWFSQTWSARLRPDGTFEPDYPISAVGIAPNPDDKTVITTEARRSLMTRFAKIRPDEPFFTIEGKFELVPPAASAK